MGHSHELIPLGELFIDYIARWIGIIITTSSAPIYGLRRYCSRALFVRNHSESISRAHCTDDSYFEFTDSHLLRSSTWTSLQPSASLPVRLVRSYSGTCLRLGHSSVGTAHIWGSTTTSSSNHPLLCSCTPCAHHLLAEPISIRCIVANYPTINRAISTHRLKGLTHSLQRLRL